MHVKIHIYNLNKGLGHLDEGMRWSSGMIVAIKSEGSKLESDPRHCVATLCMLFTPNYL